MLAAFLLGNLDFEQVFALRSKVFHYFERLTSPLKHEIDSENPEKYVVLFSGCQICYPVSVTIIMFESIIKNLILKDL